MENFHFAVLCWMNAGNTTSGLVKCAMMVFVLVLSRGVEKGNNVVVVLSRRADAHHSHLKFMLLFFASPCCFSVSIRPHKGLVSIAPQSKERSLEVLCKLSIRP